MIGRESAWDGLQRTMRRVVRMRELGAEASMIARDLDRSRQLWERVAPTPPGMAIDWPSDPFLVLSGTPED